jgi:DNA-binding CsgD family transcriptional regulator
MTTPPTIGGGAAAQDACGARFEWARPTLVSYREAISGSDPLFRLLAHALDYLSSNVPALIASYALLDAIDDMFVIGPCVLMADRFAPAELEELYDSYVEHIREDPFNVALSNRPDANLLTVEDVGGLGALCDSEFGRTHLAKYGTGASARLILRDESQIVAMITLRRRRGEGDFSEAEKRLLRLSHDFLEAAHLIAVSRARADWKLMELAREHKLTPREQEIAGLVGRAMSNAEIAERLTISDRTVKNHLCRIYGKVGVSNRAQLARLITGRSAPHIST